MTIKEVKAKAKFICDHTDPSGKPISGYYDESEDIYYITYNPEARRNNKEFVTSKKGSEIKDDLLFDPFSELKMIIGLREMNKKKATPKISEKSEKNYWMMLCNPNMWFGDKDIQNAQVNDLLFNMTEFTWTTGRNNFEDIKDGDLGIIKVGSDHRSKACRTIDGEIVPKLDAGIYAIVEFISKDGDILHEDNDGIKRVHLKVVRNLFKENNIISKQDTEKLLQKHYKSFSSKKLPEDIYI